MEYSIARNKLQHKVEHMCILLKLAIILPLVLSLCTSSCPLGLSRQLSLLLYQLCLGLFHHQLLLLSELLNRMTASLVIFRMICLYHPLNLSIRFSTKTPIPSLGPGRRMRFPRFIIMMTKACKIRRDDFFVKSEVFLCIILCTIFVSS